VVYAWNLQHLTLTVCLRAQELGIPVCFFVFDHWFTQLEKDPWCSLIAHRPQRAGRKLVWVIVSALLRQAGLVPRSTMLNCAHVQFASRYLKHEALQAGRQAADAQVIHWGIDPNRYRYKTTDPQGGCLLYVGQLAPHKGVHTAIEALHHLIRHYGKDGATLTIVGGSMFPRYAAELRQLTARFGLDSRVRFLGQLAPEKLAAVYAEHDLLLFPSVWDEPFGITILEGMAAGIPVVATASGGAAEIVRDELNALVFAKGDADACARCVSRLLEDRTLYERIRAGGRRTVEERFRLERTIDRIEQDLSRLAGSKPAEGDT
jgi:glycogen(starch) synthase